MDLDSNRSRNNHRVVFGSRLHCETCPHALCPSSLSWETLTPYSVLTHHLLATCQVALAKLLHQMLWCSVNERTHCQASQNKFKIQSQNLYSNNASNYYLHTQTHQNLINNGCMYIYIYSHNIFHEPKNSIMLQSSAYSGIFGHT